MRSISITAFVIFFLNLPAQDTIRVMSYNLLHFPDGPSWMSCDSHIPQRWDTLRKIVQYTEPDVLMVCELQTEESADSILKYALNVFGTTSYKRASFVLNQSGYTDLNNAFFYNSDKLLLQRQDEILTDVRDVGEYITYYNDPNLSSYNDTIFIDFYMAHLKAGSSSSNQAQREEECDSIRKHIDAKAIGRNNILGGDLNFYDAAEAGYQKLTNSGTYPFNDPLGREGSWSSNSAYADVHTQSTRTSTTDMDCGAYGGLDDRFDFILVSGNILNGSDSVEYISGSYTALGNDGDDYNMAINHSANIAAPDSVLSALYYTSDHLPVYADFLINYPLAPLSLHLFSFKGEMAYGTVILEWKTASDELQSFYLQKSPNGKKFTEVEKITGQNKFSYRDKNPYPGVTYYRLRSHKDDYSNVIAIKSLENAISLFPNPFSEELKISSGGKEIRQVQIFNLLGEKIFEETLPNGSLPLSGLPKGMYIVKLNLEEGTIIKRINKI